MSDEPGTRDPDEFLPLKAQDFQVLLTLAKRPLHAYGIAKAVDEDERGTVRLEIGSLYRMLARMLTAGLIEEIEPPPSGAEDDDDPASASSRRRTYRISAFGRRVAEAEARRLGAVLDLARERDLLTDGAGSRA